MEMRERFIPSYWEQMFPTIYSAYKITDFVLNHKQDFLFFNKIHTQAPTPIDEVALLCKERRAGASISEGLPASP